MTPEQFNDDILPMHAPMYRVAFSLLKDSDAAADAVQDCMLRLWSRRDSFDSITEIRPYCLMTIRNHCLTVLKQNHMFESIDQASNIASDTNACSDLEHRQSMAMLDSAIDSMPEHHREVLKLSTYGGCSNSEIATLTGLTEVNVRAILSRGRKKLRLLFS